MASIAAIRDGIKTRLATISGLYTHDTIPDDIYPPAAIVGAPTRISYDDAFRTAKTRFDFPVRVLAGRAIERESQDRLDGYLSADGVSSVRAAIDGDPTLGGVVDYCRVSQGRDYGAYQVAGVDYIGVELVLEVIA